MRKLNLKNWSLASVLTSGLLLTVNGCQNLPGTKGEQGAAVGGVGGAVAGAVIGGENHRLLGALIGGVAGAGGGYLIGANSDRITGHDTSGAERAVQDAQQHPATPTEAMSAPTADLNGDGFVTMDEVVAMKQAGLSDQQILQKLQATSQVFELTPQQQDYLRQNGVDQYVIDQMPQINRDLRNRLLSQPSGAEPAYPNPPPTYQSAPPTYQAPPPAYPNAPAGTLNPSPNTPVPPPPGP